MEIPMEILNQSLHLIPYTQTLPATRFLKPTDQPP